MKPKKIYLSGFEVCEKNYFDLLQNMRKICSEYGFIGICYNEQDNSQEELFKYKLTALDNSDLVVANLNFFRGLNVWDTIAFEIGYAYAKGKTIYGYTSDIRPLREKLGKGNVTNFSRDNNLPVSLLLAESVTIVKGDFEQCLKFICNVM